MIQCNWLEKIPNLLNVLRRHLAQRVLSFAKKIKIWYNYNSAERSADMILLTEHKKVFLLLKTVDIIIL